MANISTSKGNQTTRFGQLTEYNMRNIFLEKPYRECGGETRETGETFLKIKVGHISGVIG